VKGANVIYSDTFVSMGEEREKETKLREFLPKYRVSTGLLERASSDAIFMHCLPAYRGMEVEAEVIDGPSSIVWDQAENRLHSAKSVLLKLLASADVYEEILEKLIG